MQIVIVGCGKVGRYLVRELSEENHDITIVDLDSDSVRNTALEYDVMGVEGNGTSYTTLEEAGIKTADILIAVTQSDEVNLLCCFMVKKEKCKTIARVRNPIYSAESEIFKQELGISMIINPEREGAAEMLRLLQFPSAVDIGSFAKGKIDLLSFRVNKNSILAGRKVKDLTELQKYQMLICIVERGKEVYIPNGDFVIEESDIVSFIAHPGNASRIFRELGIFTNAVKSAIIIGMGQTGYYLAEMMIEAGMKVKVIDIDKKRCEEIAMDIPGADVIYGDGSDVKLLDEEHIEMMDACICSTNIDEENIIISLYAREKVRKKVVTKISHLEFNNVIQSLNLDSVVNPKETTAESILLYVRAMSNTTGSNVQTLYRLKDDSVEAIEFIVHKESELIGIQLKDMKLKDGVLIAGIMRNDKLIIPGGTDSFEADDSVVIATINKGFLKLEDILER